MKTLIQMDFANWTAHSHVLVTPSAMPTYGHGQTGRLAIVADARWASPLLGS